MRETRQSGSEGGAAFIAPSLPLSLLSPSRQVFGYFSRLGLATS